MDWNKTRKYLIYMLVLINLLILSSVIKHNNNASIDNPYFSRENMADFDRLLEMKNIKLEADLPRDIYLTGSVNAEYRDFNKINHPKLFLDYDIKTFENSKKITIRLDKMLQTIGEDEYNILNARQRKEFAQAFLKKYFPSNTYLEIKSDDENFLTYKILYKDFIFEESMVNFKFGSSVVIITATDLRPREDSANKKNTISSVEAVLSVLPQLKSGDVIKDIRLLYHFDLPAEELYKVKYVRVFPYWKITTQDDVIYTLAL